MKKLLELLGTILVTSNAVGPLIVSKPNNNKIKNNLQTLNRQKRQVFTDLHFAIHENYINKVKFLLLQQTDVNKEDEHGWIPLLIAVKNNNLNIVQELLTNENSKDKININIKNKFSQTPPHLAAQNCNLAMVKLLLDYGVATDTVDNDDNTALVLAEKRKYLDIRNLLEENNNNSSYVSANSGLSLDIEKRQAPAGKKGKNEPSTQNSTSRDIKFEFIEKDITLDENYSDNINTMLNKFADKNHISPFRKIGGFLSTEINSKIEKKDLDNIRGLKILIDDFKKQKK